jgi:CHAT domain-containing protein
MSRSLRGPVVVLLGASCVAAAGAANPRTFEDCLAGVRTAPEKREAWTCFLDTARALKQPELAARHLDSLLAVDPRRPWARLTLARCLEDAGDPRADEEYRSAIAAFESREELEGRARAGILYSGWLANAGRPHEAAEALDAAEVAARGLPDGALATRARIDRALLWFRLADYGAARTLLLEIESDLGPDAPDELKARCLNGLGHVAYNLDREAEALELYRRSAEHYGRAGDARSRAASLFNRALVAHWMARVGRLPAEQAIVWIDEALSAARETDYRSAEARSEALRAELTGGRESLEASRRALETARRQGDVWALNHALAAHAIVLLSSDEGDAERAFDLLHEAVEIARRSGNRARYGWSLNTLATQRRLHGERGQAIADSLRALEVLESIRDLQPDHEVRARAFRAMTSAYTALQAHLLLDPHVPPAPDELDLAFQVVERMRARVLLDELDAAGATERIAPRGELQDERNELLREIAGAQRTLADPALDEAPREEALALLARLERDEAAQRDRLARSDPRYAAARPVRFPTLEDARRALDEDEALLSFQVTGRASGQSVLVAHAAAGSRVHALPDLEHLDAEVALFLGLIERGDDSERAGAVSLYDKLLGAAMRELPPGVHRLTIVADDVLHRLPFAALRPAVDAPALAESHEISVVPSATLWLRWKEAVQAPAAALVLADPKLDFAGSEPGVAREASWTAGLRLGPLPHARTEARAATRRLGGASRMLAGRRASEDFLKRTDLARYGILHLATHGWIDEQHPERSAVFLAPGADDEDGLLQIRDIVELDLAGRLVVLSACRSASGELLAGEGVMGLARAFFQAGARTVVGSLWPLRDRATSRLISDLYRHLATGADVSTALASAQRDAIRAGEPSAAWAGLVVLGDGGLVPAPAGGKRGLPNSSWVATLLGLVGLVAIVLVRRVRARRRSGSTLSDGDRTAGGGGGTGSRR